MLHKSLVSFIAALAVVTSVTASATPVVRNGGSGCSANTGSLSCCNMVTTINDPIVAALQSLADIAIPIDPSIPLGINCLGILDATQCVQQPVCCENVSQSGLINVGCTPINIGL